MASSAHHTTASMPLSLILILAAIAISNAQASSSSSCASHTFSSNQVYASCAALPHLGTTLHYNYTAGDNNTVSVAFRAPSSGGGGWVAWGINPSGSGMVGAWAVVAFRGPDGSVVAYPTLLDSYAPSMAPAAAEDEGQMGFSDVAAEYVKGGKEMVVYATVALPGGKKGSEFNHVWQQGSSVVDGVPAAHPTTGDNILSTGTIDFSK